MTYALALVVLLIPSFHATLRQAPGDIHGLHFLSPQEGWMVGKDGAIFHTTDGGESFDQVSSGEEVLLTSVDFPDPGHGWAVGEAGTILRTDDHGKTWVTQKSPVPYNLLGVFALGENEAWIVGDWGTMLHTKDAGATWEDRSLTMPIQKAGPTEPAAFTDVIDPETGKVLVKKGDDVSQEVRDLARRKGISIRIREDVILNDAYFLNSYTGWIVGEAGLLLRTKDGGRSFTRWVLGQGSDPFGPPPASLYGVVFAPGVGGFAVGLMGTVYKVGTGAGTPVKVKTGTESDLYSVSVNSGTVCIAGTDGTVLVSVDGGKSFQSVKEKGLSLTWLRRASAVDGVCFFGGKDGTLLKVAPEEE